ncbi:hypothetical protein [Frankia sp. Mgl5]|uniref:hypothetical protein n=1 Tax=Frankia sp. Mgl5 TaxID=2933793 RepID=UPI0020105FBA|nr:hypothetical protein [Frankia sp. Mgl5]
MLSVFALSLYIGWLSLNEILVVAIFEIFAIAIAALPGQAPSPAARPSPVPASSA